jgi:hypothetical protein
MEVTYGDQCGALEPDSFSSVRDFDPDSAAIFKLSRRDLAHFARALGIRVHPLAAG